MDLTKRPLLAAGIILLLLFGLAGLAGAEPGGEQNAKQETKLKSSFSDVAAGNKNLLFINYLAERGIISGFSDGSYHPTEGLSRAEAAVVMVKAAGLELENGIEIAFPDVNSEYWAAPYIAAATHAGYLKGFPDGSYHPDEKLTRAQGISLVMRLCTQKQDVTLPELKDMNSGHWAAQPISMAIAAGMIDFSAEGEVYPEKVMERGSLARALGILLTRDPGLYVSSLTGTIKDVKGEIKLTRSGHDSSLINGSPVYAGDLIKAGPKSSASIFYPDGSSVLVEENTEITIKESAGRAYIKKDGQAGTAVENLDIGLNRGTVFGALAGKQEKGEKQVARKTDRLLASLDGTGLLAAQETLPWYQTAEQKKVKMKVDMPWGVAAVRGTFIKVTVNNDGSIDLSCLSGEVDLSNKDQNGQLQNTTNVNGGNSGGVTGQGGLTPVEGMSEADKQAFEQVQKWVLETALQIDANRETALEMIVETPGLQVQSTLKVIVEALQNSGIQLQQEVIENLKQQLEELQQEIPNFGQTTGQTETTANQNTGGSTETTSVSYINYSSPGTYGPTSAENRQSIAKNVIVSAPGVTLQNMIISRGLTLAAGIGEGDVTLNNVTVAGNTSILGGGAESIELIDCQLYTISVDKENNSIRIVAQGSTSLGTVTLNSGAVLEESDLTGDGFGDVLTSLSITEGATITLSGNFASINIEAPGLIIEVESGNIGEFTIASSASNTSLNLEPGTSIDTLQVNAAAQVGGEGSINTANINASGVTIEQTPLNLYVSNNVEANVGGQPVSGGSTRIVSVIEISGAQSINVPASGTASGTYAAVVKDQQGNAMTGESVTWSLLTAVNGVSIGASTGILSVGNETTATSCTIVATSVSNGSRSGEFDVTLVAFEPVAATVEITGDTCFSIPAGNSICSTYTALVRDELGNEMAEESLTWSIEEQETLGDTIGIDSAGILTVTNDAAPGPITLVAQASDNSEVYDEFTITLLPPWSYLGEGISGTLLNGSDIGMAASCCGEVFAAYTEDGDGEGPVKVSVYEEVDGTWAWNTYAMDSSYPGKGPLALDLDYDDYPLLAWWDDFGQGGGGEEAVVVMEGCWDGDWYWYSADGPYVAASVSDLSVGSIDGSSVIAYIADSSSVQVNSYWSSMGNISGLTASELEMVVGCDEDYNYYPYLAFRDGNNNIKVMEGIYDYDGWSWQTATSAASGSGLSLDAANGVPYLAYLDANGCARVSKWDAAMQQWNEMGGQASPGGAGDLSLCVVPNGTPYLAFADATRGGKASVVKYVYDSSGTFNWVPLGAGLSPDAAGGLKLDIVDDDLYLAFKEEFEDEGGNAADKLTVMSYSDPLAGVDFNFLCPIEFGPGNWELTGLYVDGSMEYSLNGGDGYQTVTAGIGGNIYETPDISAKDDILVRLVSQPDQVLRIDLLAGPPAPEATASSCEEIISGLNPGRYYDLDFSNDDDDGVYWADDWGEIYLPEYYIYLESGEVINIRQAPRGKTFSSDWQEIIVDAGPPLFVSITVGGNIVDTPYPYNWGEGDNFPIYIALDKPGTVYYVIVADDAAEPSVDQVLAGKDADDNEAPDSGCVEVEEGGTVEYISTNLEGGNYYDIYIVARDEYENTQIEVTKVDHVYYSGC